MLDRKRPVAMVTVLSILLAMTFGLSSAGALPQPVAEIDTTLRYQGEPEIPGGETTPIIQVYTAINAIDMLDASNAWAVGSIQNDYSATAAKRPFIARTTDGGSTITTAEVAPNGVLNGVSAVDSANAWAVGTGAMIRKWDGVSWTAQVPPAGFTNDLRAVAFADSNTGFAVGADRRITATDNGGST